MDPLDYSNGTWKTVPSQSLLPGCKQLPPQGWGWSSESTNILVKIDITSQEGEQVHKARMSTKREGKTFMVEPL
ncbi:hypothetical protein PAXRUDRAFT_306575 [Paxillus rubicundulus Ve08.2h10]|uniref:Uncharacterized protein n=1 Tax=Paxillus rubicundulus Ve08.2h10 TaxID=930991 RepID=A0A0D0DFJ3_9AGAM|nr:hypothetical protein PAXRUDRAFT_306575 [Paxillus rubicundulus Ve08.2h10]